MTVHSGEFPTRRIQSLLYCRGNSQLTKSGIYANHPRIKAGDERSSYFSSLSWLSLEVRPCGDRQQDNRGDPEGRIAHSRFLSHEPHFRPDSVSKREARSLSVVNRRGC